MNTKRMLRVFCLIAIMGLALFGGGGQVASAPASTEIPALWQLYRSNLTKSCGSRSFRMRA